jgi:hypothetical protein
MISSIEKKDHTTVHLLCTRYRSKMVFDIEHIVFGGKVQQVKFSESSSHSIYKIILHKHIQMCRTIL